MSGSYLRNLRTARGVSGAELARRAGIDHSHVTRIELNDRRPSRETVEAIIDALDLAGAEADELRATFGFMPRAETHAIRDEPALLDLYNALRDPQIPREHRDSLRRAVSALVELAPRAAIVYAALALIPGNVPYLPFV